MQHCSRGIKFQATGRAIGYAGRYFLPLASGVYTVLVDGAEKVSGVEVDVGVKKRVDVGVERAAPAAGEPITDEEA